MICCCGGLDLKPRAIFDNFTDAEVCGALELVRNLFTTED